MDRTNRNEVRLGCIESHQKPPSASRIVTDATRFMDRLLGRHPNQPPLFEMSPDAAPWNWVANRVLKNCRVNGETGCWEWWRASGGKGYGRIKIEGALLLPHRVVAVAAGLIKGASETADPRLILHECDNRRCCNPAHLKVGTQSQNMKDCVARGRWRKRRD